MMQQNNQMPDFDTSGLCEIQQNLLVDELAGKINESGSQIVRAIENSNSDWMQFFIALGGAFFGALAAFFLNWVHEQRKERRANNAAINEVIQLFSINIMSLLNYKAQFLHKFSDEFDAISKHAAEYHPQMSDQKLAALSQEWNKIHWPVLERLFTEHEKHRVYANLNGLLIRKWEPVKLASIDVKQLYFVTNSMPDIIRLALHGLAHSDALLDALKERDEIWHKAEPALSTLLWQPHPIFMRSLYELINVRQNMLEYVDEIIIFAHATNLLLMHYQQKNFPKRKKPWKWLLGSYGWVRYDIPDEARNMMPSVEGYKKIIGPNWEKIKDNW